MSFSTFSGPIRSGTVREGAGRNTGLAILAQSVSVAATNAKTSAPTAVDLCTLPAGAKIVRFTVDKTATITGNSVSQVALIIGNSADDNQYLESVNIGTAIGQVSPATVSAGVQSDDCDNIGTTDVLLQATLTATTGNPTAGTIVITVEYVQRMDNGAQNPTSA
jgi:hypothetical protein